MYCEQQKLRTRVRGFQGFLMDHKSFPYECFEQCSTFNTDEAKLRKFSLYVDEIQ